MKIFASILSSDFSKLKNEIKKAEEAEVDGFHLDVMDGHFVPNISFGPIVVEAVRRSTSLPICSHLMIENPSKYVEAFIKAGSNSIIYHIETDSSLELPQRIKEKGCDVGIAINPNTPYESLIPFLEIVKEILFMTVEPGFGGQELKKEVLKKIEKFNKEKIKKNLNLQIGVDGGINPENAKEVKRTGANILVVGSAIFKSQNYKEVVKKIIDA